MKKKKTEQELLSANRRDFFRKVLLKGLDHAESAGKAMAFRATQFIKPDDPTPQNRANIAESKPKPTLSRPDNWLRPPGALPEKKFLQTCETCGECAKVCPANCILIDSSSDNPIADGKPYIEPRRLPCVMCEDMACMQSCPSGALDLLASLNDIKMGLAVVDHAVCFRTAKVDEGADEISDCQRDCQACVSQCPVGDKALSINDDGEIEVHEEGCTGCGVCEWVCPTTPAAIQITPIRSMDDPTLPDSQPLTV